MCRHGGEYLNDQVRVWVYMCLSLLPKCPGMACAPLLCVALCVSPCAFMRVRVYLCLCVLWPKPREGGGLTCFQSSSRGRYSAVVSPVAKWISTILLTPHLSSTPSFLRA